VRSKSVFYFVVAAAILASLAPPLQAQEDAAARLLSRMPPAARVGQLFVVTFPNTSTEETAAIYELIVEERIGGVLLQPENGNVVNEGDTPAQVATLTNNLQQLAWDASQVPLGAPGGSTTLSPFIPLFVAVEQAGNGRPYTAIVSGTTPLPSAMAIGATWNPDHAHTVGSIVGQELSALGINLLLGPSLDVLNTPRPESTADLGVRSFGGDPYWVGQLGQAYIRGVHEGSEGQVAVVPGHFPGLGAADRPLSEEVPTIQKSLEQLKQIELAPFFAVATTEDAEAQPDGLLVSHIRYRGFQGNIRSTTKPVSFDPQALQQLMMLPQLMPWREAGGLLVADELGVRAVSRFYDPTEQEFKNRNIALEAFVAGNDMLILSHFALDDDWDAHFANIRDTLAFFREKYATDPTFQAWVDEAVLRILRAKLRHIGVSATTFSLAQVQVSEEDAAGQIGQAREHVGAIARDAVTLLSPPSPDLRPAPPAADEWIVIFTDDRQLSPCAGCAPTYAIPPTLLEETLFRLYGPQATQQVSPGRVSSFTFAQLVDYLTVSAAPPSVEDTPSPPGPVEAALRQADWVIFAMLDINGRAPTSDAVRRFLAQETDLLRSKQVVVFAFGAPYYLDTTEIAKLTSYFGLYSHVEPFVEAAVRAMFDEFPFAGASPVSVAGINYDLIVQTQPDASQTIQLSYEVVPRTESAEPQPTTMGTPQPTPQTIEIRQGDTLRLRTSIVVDRNGNPVPDGTPTEFIFTYPQEGLEHSVQVTTLNGVAETTTTLDRVGQLQISVRAEPVPRAVRLEVDIREGGTAVVVAITPTPSPTPPPTLTPTLVPTPLQTAAPPQETGPEETETRQRGRVDWGDLLLGIATVACAAAASYFARWRLWPDPVAALRTGLWTVIGGLAAYVLFALGLPGADWAQEHLRGWAPGIAAASGSATAWLVLLVSERVRKPPGSREHEGTTPVAD
jgi:beta-N-acetylhexosaminidase